MTVDHLKMLHAAGGKGKVFSTGIYLKENTLWITLYYKFDLKALIL